MVGRPARSPTCCAPIRRRPARSGPASIPRSTWMPPGTRTPTTSRSTCRPRAIRRRSSRRTLRPAAAARARSAAAPARPDEAGSQEHQGDHVRSPTPPRCPPTTGTSAATRGTTAYERRRNVVVADSGDRHRRDPARRRFAGPGREGIAGSRRSRRRGPAARETWPWRRTSPSPTTRRATFRSAERTWATAGSPRTGRRRSSSGPRTAGTPTARPRGSSRSPEA